MDGERFDSFARGMAGGIDRRRALKSIGVGLVAVVAPFLGRSAVDASNSSCAHFCNAVFPPGPARGKCKSDAAKHVPGNLCESCGADVSHVCAGANGVISCCAEGQTCNTATGVCAEIGTCTFASCQAAGGGTAACCGTKCGLLAISECDPLNDRCCGTLNNDPTGDYCKATPDSPSGLSHRCCIATSHGHPCSGIGGNHCAPNSACDTCCSGLCGPADENGHAVCVDALAE